MVGYSEPLRHDKRSGWADKMMRYGTIPFEQRTLIVQLYPVVLVTSRRSWLSSTIPSRTGTNRGWKNMSPPVFDATFPALFASIVILHRATKTHAPIDPMSMKRLMPKNRLTPTPSSAHSSAKVCQNGCRGAYKSFSFSVPWNWFSDSNGWSEPRPIVGNVAWNTTVWPPRPA